MIETSDKYILRASHLIELGRWSAAIEELLRAKAIDPENSYATCLLSQSYLGLGDLRKGLKYAGEAAGLDPEEEWAHRLRAIALSGLGKKKEALSAALEAARLDPDDAFVLSTLAEIQLESGKLEDAGSTAEKLRELHPELEMSHLTYGNYCLKRGDHRSAERSFEKAVEINPLSSDARNNLAIAIKLRGEAAHPSKTPTLSILETKGEDEVDRHLGEAIKLDPTSETAKQNFQNQFRYDFTFYLGLALLPIGIMAFVVRPGWAVIWTVTFLFGVFSAVRSVQQRRNDLAGDLKSILDKMPRLSLKQRLAELAAFLGKFYRKTWPAHAVALVGVIIRFIDFGEASKNSGSNVFGFVFIVAAVVWLGRLMNKDDD